MFGNDVVQFFLELLDFSCCNLNIGGLPLSPTHGLVYHHSRMAQRKALALGSGHKQHSRHRRRHAGAYRGNIARYILHGVIDAKTGIHAATGRIDIDAHILARVRAIEVQQLGLYHIGGIIIYLRA